MIKFATRVDARKYPPREKHDTIFAAFEGLQPGQKMELTNDHDPKPLYYQMMAEYTDQFNWEYLEEGPEVWRVAIGKN
ncbi:MAG TPA: DUF2249 domain-containing protein [Clostridia bacterium]|nr:DUF2249 domain-containing protein [Clostridia bacterium]